MLLTEEEAKSKWCPFAHVASVMVANADGVPVPVAADNRKVWKGAPVANCIGSACMAWRWGDPQAADQKPGWTWRSMTGGSGHAYHDGKYVLQPRRGYCGLAGRVG